ncbi:MAG: hypothetical protein R3F30_09925 [Planctomycetota bacterium]
MMFLKVRPRTSDPNGEQERGARQDFLALWGFLLCAALLALASVAIQGGLAYLLVCTIPQVLFVFPVLFILEREAGRRFQVGPGVALILWGPQLAYFATSVYVRSEGSLGNMVEPLFMLPVATDVLLVIRFGDPRSSVRKWAAVVLAIATASAIRIFMPVLPE